MTTRRAVNHSACCVNQSGTLFRPQNKSSPGRTRTVASKGREIVCETVSDSVSAAESGAVGVATTGGDGLAVFPESTGIDPALRLLVEVWEELPDSVTSQILRLAGLAA